MSHPHSTRPVIISIGILACNEAGVIGTVLESLFRQSIFNRLSVRGAGCEILVLANGCNDGTTQICREIFERMRRDHPWRDGFTARVIELERRDRANAWNRFAHEFSAMGARYLITMDANILLHHR